MQIYTPPLKDILFILEDVLGAPEMLARLPSYAEVDADLMQQVIEEAGRFAKGILLTTNVSGDQIGCRYETGTVVTPPGFTDAYRQFQEAGWPALICSPDDGGQGLPHLINCVLYEMLSAANHAWAMYPGLLHGAYACLRQHASDQLKERYLPKIVSGEWLATMCLTEASAGSDLGLLRTRAIPAEDGSVRISGTKIFISGGEQDLTQNIVHLVLARLPDAPPGSKGISLFLVPKFLPNGARNTLHCTGIEHKMGIRGSATCSMQFDEATGWLIGEPHRGLAAMFVMMNAARLNTGVQAIGIADAAYQQALAYACERVQMKAVGRPAHRASEPADPIVMHPAVQRLLMSQRAAIEGGRMLAYWTALQLDGAEKHPDASVRHSLHGQVSLITPIVKALLSDQAFQCTSQALQVFGGHGYITESGVEQYLRDIRVLMLYEGTNEIQAIDLLIRKILPDNGSTLRSFLSQVEEIASCSQYDELRVHVEELLKLTDQIREAVTILGNVATDLTPYDVADDVLRLVGHCAIGWLWLRAGVAALRSKDKDPIFHAEKMETLQHYFVFLFPETQHLLGTINKSIRFAGTRPERSTLVRALTTN